jgi:hypothetical protein
VVLSFTGTEKISGLFSFDLLLASEQNDISFEQLAGKNATVAIGSSDGDKRFFNGIITGFTPSRTSARESYSQYRATLQPSAWLLTQFRCPTTWRHPRGLRGSGRYIVRVCFFQERMTYIPACETADGKAKVIYSSKDRRESQTFNALVHAL